MLSKRDDTRVTHVTRICEARAADPEDAAVLGLKRGRPVHYFQTIGYNQSGKLIELSFATTGATRAGSVSSCSASECTRGICFPFYVVT